MSCAKIAREQRLLHVVKRERNNEFYAMRGWDGDRERDVKRKRDRQRERDRQRDREAERETKTRVNDNTRGLQVLYWKQCIL